MGFVRRARDRHFRAMCRCPSPRTTSNGLLRLGYSVHPTSLSRSHPVDLPRQDLLCFAPSRLHHCLCRVVGVGEDRCTAELHPDAGGKADNGREKDGAFSLSPSIPRPGRALLCPPPRLCTTIPPYATSISMEGVPHCRQGTEHYCQDNSPGVAHPDGPGGRVVPEAKAMVTARSGSTLDSLVVDWAGPLSQDPKPSKQGVYKSEPPVRPPHPVTAGTSIGEPLCSHLFLPPRLPADVGVSQQIPIQRCPTNLCAFSERHAARQDGGPGSGSGSTCCGGGCPASPPLLHRPHWPRGNGKQMVI